MSSIKESNPNDITTTQRDPKSDVEMDSPATPSKAGSGGGGWFSVKNLIIIGVAAIVALGAVGLILFFTLPSTPSETPTAEALVGNISTPTEKPSESIATSTETILPPNETPSETKTSSSSPVTTPGAIPDSSTSESTSNNATESTLIYAQILFRHGARAPDHRLPDEWAIYFPRGRGQLTDRGFNHSHLMGLFLKKRYVESGFLNERMDPEEMKWYSRQISRVLGTASTVSSAMFRTPSRKYISVPVVSNKPDHDRLLNFAERNCSVREKFKKECLNKSEPYNKYEEALKCIKNTHEVFKHIDIKQSDIYINMYRNNIPLPEEIRGNYSAISAGFMEVRNYLNGIGRPDVVKIKFGVLVNKLLKDLKSAWESHGKNEKALKFKAYSTQDWVMGGVLDAFNVLKYIQSTGPKEEPHYNTLILIELWKTKDGKPFVKFLYKPEEITELDHKLLDLTERIPGCNGQKECPLKVFNKCCDSTRIKVKELKKACRWDNK